MTLSPLELLQLLLLLQAVLLALLLLSQKSLWPLAAFMAALALHMGWNIAESRIPVRIDIRPGLAFLYGPLLLALTQQLAWRDSPVKWWKALIPACMAPLLFALLPGIGSLLWPTVAIWTGAHLVVAFRTIGRYEHILRATHSAYEYQSLRWMRDCLAGLTAVALSDALRLILRPYLPDLDMWLAGVTYVLALLVVLYLVWCGWRQQLRFAGLARDEQTLVESHGADHQASPNAEEVTPPMIDWQALATVFEAHVDRTHPYLDPQLTVGALAQQLGWPPRQLSAFLNQHYGRNFNDVINAARVRIACQMLGDTVRQNDKLIAIQLDAGFASRSVFNAAFRRETGMSPDQWRKTHGMRNSPA
jgi:AraC-like DNA-binding protein